MFSALNATMLHSLGFTGNDRIVAVWSTESKQGQQQVEACYDDLVHWRAKNGIFESVAIASSVNLDTRLLGGRSASTGRWHDGEWKFLPRAGSAAAERPAHR